MKKKYRSTIYLKAAKLIPSLRWCCHALREINSTKEEYKLFKILFEFTGKYNGFQQPSWFIYAEYWDSSRINALKLTSKCAKELNNTKTDKQSKLILAKYKKLAHTLYKESL